MNPYTEKLQFSISDFSKIDKSKNNFDSIIQWLCSWYILESLENLPTMHNITQKQLGSDANQFISLSNRLKNLGKLILPVKSNLNLVKIQKNASKIYNS